MACTYILINIERVSKHSVIILGLPVVTTRWSWAWTNRTSLSNGVGLDSPLAACSVYGDVNCSVHTVNNLCLFNCQWHGYLCNWRPYVRLAYMPNRLSSWNKVSIILLILCMLSLLLKDLLFQNILIVTAASVKCRVAALNSILVLHQSADYIFWSLMINELMLVCSEYKILLMPALGGVTDVAVFSISHEQTQ